MTSSFIGCVFFLATLVLSDIVAAGNVDSCVAIKDGAERLACYDHLANAVHKSQSSIAVNGVESPVQEHFKHEEKLSIVGDFFILPHRPMYFMPVTYMEETYPEPFRDVYGDQVDKIENVEAKFQLSFKVPLWLDIADKNMELWFGYTQLSLWQLYNRQVSSPFRETNYEPELMLVVDTNYRLFGTNNIYTVLGLNHQSNGQSRPLSRSWNRLYAAFLFEHNNMLVYVKPWYRLPQNGDDDNADISKYLGYGELSLYYRRNKRVTGLKLWNNLRSSSNRTSVQLDWSFPMNSRFKGYIQLFNGYGETLIDYNHRVKRLGIGIMLTDRF